MEKTTRNLGKQAWKYYREYINEKRSKTMYQMTEKQIEEYMVFLYEQEKSLHTMEKYRRDIYKFYHYLP